MVLNASAASVLKTETSIDCDEFLFSDGIWHLDYIEMKGRKILQGRIWKMLKKALKNEWINL